MITKVLYLNWFKLEREDRLSLTLSGDFQAERPDLYDYVYTYTMADLVPNIEDVLFEKLNLEDRMAFIPAKRIRSMSVGDVVLIDGKAIVCQGMGWKTLDSVPDAFHTLTEVNEQRR